MLTVERLIEIIREIILAIGVAYISGVAPDEVDILSCNVCYETIWDYRYIRIAGCCSFGTAKEKAISQPMVCQVRGQRNSLLVIPNIRLDTLQCGTRRITLIIQNYHRSVKVET